MIRPPEKVSICAPGYLGPYRSDPNFTRGKKLSNVAAKSSTHMDQMQYSIRNDQIVLAKKKVMKRVDQSERKKVDRSLAKKNIEQKKAKPLMAVAKKKAKEGQTKWKYSPETLTLCKIQK